MTSSAERLILDASECYWRLVPASALDNRQRRLRQIDAAVLLEHVAPVPAESLQCAWQRLPSGDLAICGVEVSTLQQRIGPSHTTAGPAAWPPFLASSCRDTDTERFNLLTDHFEPQAMSHARRKWHTAIALTACTIALFVLIGIERRIVSASARIHAAIQETNTLTAESIGDRGTGLASRHHLLVAERRSLERTRQRPIGLESASHALAALLDAWPDEPRSRTQSIRVDPKTASFTVLVDGQTDASAFETAWQTDTQWRLDQPRITMQRDGVRFVARAVREDTRGDEP